MSSGFALDPRLAVETHAIGALPLSELLLMDDARFPWLILVPRIAGARELIDLDEGDQRTLLAEINRVGRALEALLRPDKLNVAALGNVVPQLHVHVIARRTDDAAWPRPVWGSGERVAYAEAERATRIAALRDALIGAA
ncbi:MAG TPA: HIT domain-containing protein [Rhodanobacteraceae bacterium]|nr:HIT domain-containing protein [Rhodanobacteraceae bacterium]